MLKANWDVSHPSELIVMGELVEFDDAKVGTQIGQEKMADHWREKAECLEEWVCELLRKTQTLRMLSRENSRKDCIVKVQLRRYRFVGLFHSIFPSGRPASSTKAPETAFDSGNEPCPRQECVDIRESVKRLMMRWGCY